MWYSVIRWGRAPLNALTFFKVAGLATAVYTAPKIPAHYETNEILVRAGARIRLRTSLQSDLYF
jgi:hypothetical protein